MYELYLKYGKFTEDMEVKIDPSMWFMEGNILFIFDLDSACVLDFVLDGERVLDTIDKREVGRLKKTQ